MKIRVDAFISQGMPETASKPLDMRTEVSNRASFKVLKRNQPCQHLELTLPASRTVRLFKALNKWYFVMAALAN